jgi:hypothetical protein
MRLSQFETNLGTKNWGVDTPTVAGFSQLLGGYGAYIYCQGTSEETLQKRNRVDGSLVWEKDFNIENDTTQKILVDGLGNIYTQKAGNIYKYDSDGNLVWTCDVIPADATELHLTNVMADGSKIIALNATTYKSYILNSSGVVGINIAHGNTVYSVLFDSNSDVIALLLVPAVRVLRKYKGTTGAVLWTAIKDSGALSCFCVDTDDNLWMAYLNTNYYLGKIGGNTGNLLLSSVDTFTNVQEILPISNGNIAVVMYDSGTDVLSIDIRDGNAVQQAIETHSDITAYNSAIITV